MDEQMQDPAYLRALDSIAKIMGKCKCELSETQRLILTGALAVWIPEQATLSQPAAEQGSDPIPSYRGYALLGIGAYIIFHTDPPDEPELIIRIATASDVEGGRGIGETRRAPKRLVQPEEMAIRIGFTSVVGLDALEVQLHSLRAEHFSATPAAPKATP